MYVKSRYIRFILFYSLTLNVRYYASFEFNKAYIVLKVFYGTLMLNISDNGGNLGKEIQINLPVS